MTVTRSVAALLLALVTAFAGAGLHAHAATPLVDAPFVRSVLGKPGTVILEARGVPKAAYLVGHIPGSVYTDYAKDGWREKNAAGIDGMLPPPEKIAKLIGSFGIDNDTHVIIVHEGRTAADVGNATRIYWTFKVMGHDKVSILDGGFTGWASAIDPQTKKPINPLSTEDVKPGQKIFKPAFRAEMVVTADEVKKAMAAGTPLIDNRPYDFFIGLNRSPAAKRAGTIPGAVSLPEGWLTDNGGGRFRTREQLLKLYRAQSISPTGAHITFCNTGHWASLGWFVSSELLGNSAVRMYDGSMAEWTHDASRPVDVKMKID